MPTKKIAIIEFHAEVSALGDLNGNGREFGVYVASRELRCRDVCALGQGDVMTPAVRSSKSFCGGKAPGLIDELSTEDLIDNGEGCLEFSA